MPKPIPPAKKKILKSGLAVVRQRTAYAGPALSLADMDAAILREAGTARRKLPVQVVKLIAESNPEPDSLQAAIVEV